MKPNHKQLSAPNYPHMASASLATSAANSNHIRIDFAPSADEVARQVHLNYGIQDSLPEEVIERWLEAEAQLLAEGNATRVYGMPDQPRLRMSRATRRQKITL